MNSQLLTALSVTPAQVVAQTKALQNALRDLENTLVKIDALRADEAKQASVLGAIDSSYQNT